MTVKEQRATWNDAVRHAANEVMLFDGLIPSEIDRKYLADKIKEKWLYKREIGNREFKQQQKNKNHDR